MDKAQQVLKKMIEDLDAKLAAAREELDDCKSAHAEIFILQRISMLVAQREMLLRFKTLMGY